MKQILHHIALWCNFIAPRSWFKIGAMLSTILLAGAMTQANAQVYKITIKNAPAGANDIHLVFTGTGGGVGGITPVAPTPAGQVITNNLNGWDATWPVATAAGDTYTAQFTVIPPTFAVAFNSGFWTQNGVNIKNIAPADITIQIIGNVPTMPTWALASLIGVVVAGGIFYIRYRKNRVSL